MRPLYLLRFSTSRNENSAADLAPGGQRLFSIKLLWGISLIFFRVSNWSRSAQQRRGLPVDDGRLGF